MVNFVFSQKNKAEVLYFKAKLPCCPGRACNLLQCDVDSVVSKYFSKEKLVFKVVILAEEANKAMVEKYKAKSQTVLLIRKKGKKEVVTDLTPIVQAYSANRDKVKFETDLKAKIKEGL